MRDAAIRGALVRVGVLVALAAGAWLLHPVESGRAQETPAETSPEAPAAGAPDDPVLAPPAPEDDASTLAAPDDAPTSMIAAFFEDLSPETLKDKIEQFYDPAAVLEDPFGRYEQRTAVERHLGALLEGTKSVAFEVREEFQSGDETVALWTASVSHPRLGDEPVVIEGVTHARFVNGRIAEQRDYYDVGTLVYENVTFVGTLVRWVKAKVTGDRG